MTSHFSNIQFQIESLISSAESEINIAVAWFTNEVLFEAILKKIDKGVKTNLIIINDSINNNINGLDFDLIIQKGGNLFLSESENIMHHKFAIIDNKHLINGSYNWTYFAEYKNHENIIITQDEEIINRFSIEFTRLTRLFSKKIKYEKIKTLMNFENDLSSKRLVVEDLIFKSYSLETKGSYSSAIQVAQKAFEIDKENIKIKHAINLLETKNTSTSTKVFEHSYPLAGTNTNLIVFKNALKKATSAYRKKKYDEALVHLNLAKENNSEFAEIYFWIAICNWKKSKITEGLLACNMALKLNDKYASVLNLRGILFSEINKLDEALIDFSVSYNLNNNLYKALFNKGLINKKKGNTQQSKDDFKKCLTSLDNHLKAYPSDEEALSICGDCYSLLNDKDKAKEYYLKADKLIESRNFEDRDLNILDRIKDGKQR
jgi:tetratricopeptide (TPR) repeat protein